MNPKKDIKDLSTKDLKSLELTLGMLGTYEEVLEEVKKELAKRG